MRFNTEKNLLTNWGEKKKKKAISYTYNRDKCKLLYLVVVFKKGNSYRMGEINFNNACEKKTLGSVSQQMWLPWK